MMPERRPVLKTIGSPAIKDSSFSIIEKRVIVRSSRERSLEEGLTTLQRWRRNGMGKHSIAILVSLSAAAIIMGSYYFSSPDCISGDCENGCGVQEQAKKFRYEGCFRNGKAHGEGVFTSTNGHSYTGSFDNGMKHGKGTYRYPNGSVYEGQWVNNKREGRGKLIKDGVVIFDGEWRNDVPIRAPGKDMARDSNPESGQRP